MGVISYLKYQTPSEIISIPIYEVADVSYPLMRIETQNGVGCFDLIDPTPDTPIRVETPLGTKGINLQEGSGNTTNLVDPNNFDRTNTSIVTVFEDTTEYLSVETPNNGHGLKFPLTGLVPNTTYNVSVNVEILQSIDDVVTIHIRNVTQNKYIKVSLANASFILNTKQLLEASFVANHVEGDIIEMWVFQSWRNSTHDNPFRFRIYKDMTVL